MFIKDSARRKTSLLFITLVLRNLYSLHLLFCSLSSRDRPCFFLLVLVIEILLSFSQFGKKYQREVETIFLMMGLVVL